MRTATTAAVIAIATAAVAALLLLGGTKKAERNDKPIPQSILKECYERNCKLIVVE